MSIQAVSWALEQIAPMAPKFILVCLANYADAQGECWPSLEKIAVDASCGKRSVQRYLDELDELGLVEKTKTEGKRGRFSTTLYRLPIRPVAKLTTGQIDHESNRPVVSAGHAPMATGGHCIDEPSIEPSNIHGGVSAGEASESFSSESPSTEKLGAFVDRIYLEVNDPRLCRHKSVNLAASETHIARWINAGIDRNAVIIPTLKAVMAARKDSNPVNGWNYFDRPMRDAHHRHLESQKPFDLGESNEPIIRAEPRFQSASNGRRSVPISDVFLQAEHRAREAEQRRRGGVSEWSADELRGTPESAIDGSALIAAGGRF